MTKLNFDFNSLDFAPVLKTVKQNDVPPVTVSGRETAKGKRTAFFTFQASLLGGALNYAFAYNEAFYIFRFTPDVDGYEVANAKGKKAAVGRERVTIAVPWPANLPFDKARVGCGYEARDGHFFVKYPKAAGNNPDIHAPVRLTPIPARTY